MTAETNKIREFIIDLWRRHQLKDIIPTDDQARAIAAELSRRFFPGEPIVGQDIVYKNETSLVDFVLTRAGLRI